VLFLDIPMVPLSTFTVSSDGERLIGGGFSLSETVHLGRFEFIDNYFGTLSHLLGGATQAPPSWTQPIAGHHPHGGL
jgi:hypothetical protein